MRDLRDVRRAAARLGDGALGPRSVALRAHAASADEPFDVLQAMGIACEAARRTLGVVPTDAQIHGALTVLRGAVVEMAAGEGKRVAAALAAGAAAIVGEGVHVLAADGGSAGRALEVVRPVVEGMGLSVGLITEEPVTPSTTGVRRAAYWADVTVAPVAAVVQDLLRDHTHRTRDLSVQRPLAQAVLLGADTVLVDLADVAVTVDASLVRSDGWYKGIQATAAKLEPRTHYVADRAHTCVTFTEEGHAFLSRRFRVAATDTLARADALRCLRQGLRAHYALRIDRDYVLRERHVVPLDPHTGKPDTQLEPWSPGVEAALRAKHGLPARPTRLMVGRLTVAALARSYPLLGGLTASVTGVEEGLRAEYGVEVEVLAPSEPVVRTDLGDVVWLSRTPMWDTVVADIAAQHERGQPVLVRAVRAEDTLHLSRLLDREDVPHRVVDVRRSAEVVRAMSEAGRPFGVTITSGTAGLDGAIPLGGPDGSDIQLVRRLGGLHVIGLGRDPLRRRDELLLAMAGAGGEPGSCRFHLVLGEGLPAQVYTEETRLFLERNAAGKQPRLESGRLDDEIHALQRRLAAQRFAPLVRDGQALLDAQTLERHARRDELSTDEGSHRFVVDAIRTVTASICRRNRRGALLEVVGVQRALAARFGVEVDLGDLRGGTVDDTVEPVVGRLLEAYGRAEDRVIDRLQRAAEAVGRQLGPNGAVTRWRRHEREAVLDIVDAAWMHHLDVMHAVAQRMDDRTGAPDGPSESLTAFAADLHAEMVRFVEEGVTQALFRTEGPDEAGIKAAQARRQERTRS